jgi:regulator of replication initiation timing
MALGLLVLLPVWPLSAQDNVTIPKSRLEELERKEMELERLKGNLGKTNDANARLKKENQKPAAKPPAAPPAAQTASPITTNVAPAAPARSDTELERIKSELTKTKDENLRLKRENEKAAARLQAAPIVSYVSPPMVSLPPLKAEDVVEAMDLANYYHADAAAADQRYRKQKFTVRGEVVGFEKPPFATNYRILLKTPDRATKVICELNPPENANAVFTTNHGEQLVALAGERRVPMLKVGDTVQVAGWCRGANGSDVNFSGTDLRVAR